jgi:hypothetical protein
MRKVNNDWGAPIVPEKGSFEMVVMGLFADLGSVGALPLSCVAPLSWCLFSAGIRGQEWLNTLHLSQRGGFHS